MQAPKNLRYVYPLIRFHLTYGHANRTEFRHSIFVVLYFFWSRIFTVDTQFSLRVKRFWQCFSFHFHTIRTQYISQCTHLCIHISHRGGLLWMVFHATVYMPIHNIDAVCASVYIVVRNTNTRQNPFTQIERTHTQQLFVANKWTTKTKGKLKCWRRQQRLRWKIHKIYSETIKKNLWSCISNDLQDVIPATEQSQQSNSKKYSISWIQCVFGAIDKWCFFGIFIVVGLVVFIVLLP